MSPVAASQSTTGYLDLSFTAHPRQLAFLSSEARYRLFIGGIGSGKTYAGALAAGKEAIVPHTLGMVIAPTYPMLRDATVRTFMEVCGPAVKDFNKSEMRATIRHGGEVLFRSADAPDRLRGPNASWAWLDEAGQLPDAETWKIVIGRLRENSKAGRAWVTTTPKGYNWLYEIFGPRAAGDDIQVFTSRTQDNPYLAPDFIKALETQYSGAFAQQELGGSFVSVEGSVFTGVRAAVVHEPWPAEPYKGTFIGGVDWGQSNDYTVVTVIDAGTRRVVDKVRINGVEHAMLRGEVKRMQRKWGAVLMVCEANSIGRPNIEALAAEGVPVHPFTTTNLTKRTIIQQLQYDIENKIVGLPNEPVMLSELEAFQQEQTSTGLMKFEAPPGGHDDECIALALANWGCSGTNSVGVS